MLTYHEICSGSHLRAISQEVLMNLICNMCSEITLLKLPPRLPGANELNLHLTFYAELLSTSKEFILIQVCIGSVGNKISGSLALKQMSLKCSTKFHSPRSVYYSPSSKFTCIGEKARIIFSCDQAALQMVFSVCPSVRPSVCHTFLTMFPSSYHHKIFRSYYQWPK